MLKTNEIRHTYSEVGKYTRMDWMKIVNIKKIIYEEKGALHNSVHYCSVTYTA
jgi:hypothetical protein